jgi:hypothetical protein
MLQMNVNGSSAASPFSICVITSRFFDRRSWMAATRGPLATLTAAGQHGRARRRDKALSSHEP